MGTAVERGLSGGVNEMISLPRIFLLDEPLTGLDSTRAVEVMTSLSRAAREHNTTVMLTIHQPSSALYECFDRLLLMGPGGRTAYFGDTCSAVPHFSKLGHALPEHWSPADHFIELLVDESTCQSICEHWSGEARPRPASSGVQVPVLAPMPPLCYQIRVLIPRAFKRFQRTYLKRQNFVLNMALAVIWGLMYFRLGPRVAASDSSAIKDLVGCMLALPWWLSWIRFTSNYYFCLGALLRAVCEPYNSDVYSETVGDYHFSELGSLGEAAAMLLMTLFYRCAALIQLIITTLREPHT